MSYTQRHEHDIFVSYASVDDQPPASVSSGWVSTLVNEIKRALSAELGFKDSAAIWMDYLLESNSPITPTILDALDNSAVILVILSRGYLESRWCEREFQSFVEKLRGDAAQRIFLVEKTAIGWDDKPAAIRDIKGKPFWFRPANDERCYTLGDPAPDPSQIDYYRRTVDLAGDIAKVLRDMREALEAGPEAPAAQQQLSGGASISRQKSGILLADVTDDLIDQRDAVRRYLQQQNLPVIERYYPTDPAEFQQELRADLVNASLFVQLLSPLAGRRLPGAEDGFPQLQYQTALQAEGVEILQWYSPEIEIESLPDGAQKQLMHLQTVIAEPFENFKARIVSQWNKPVVQPHVGADTLVFVNFGAQDAALAEGVMSVIHEMGMETAAPLTEGRPSELRSVMEQLMCESQAMVLLYGAVRPTWVTHQLLQFRKLRCRNGRKKSIAVYQGPPSEVKFLGLHLSNMSVIDCRSAPDYDKVREFLQSCCNG